MRETKRGKLHLLRRLNMCSAGAHPQHLHKAHITMLVFLLMFMMHKCEYYCMKKFSCIQQKEQYPVVIINMYCRGVVCSQSLDLQICTSDVTIIIYQNLL